MNPPQIEEYVQESQQATQVATQPDLPMGTTLFQRIGEEVYACFQPCSSSSTVPRIDLVRPRRIYTVGRNFQNDIKLAGLKISSTHCELEWDGSEDANASISVYDTSTNGTWINGDRVKRGERRLLRDGNEVAFGTPMEQSNQAEDYRYIFRILTGNRRVRGINASYDIANELGKGSFATVMKALHRPTGKYYAVKIIHGSKIRGDDATRLDALMREIMILESLDHPNICSMKEQFHEKGDENIYLVLELIEGGDLLDYIVAQGGVSEGMSKHIARQVCEALAYIHSKGVTHRDLKPENILLTKDDPPIAKVADFGLAKVVNHLTMLRTMCGTPNYLAPEVVATGADRGYGNKVDSFSVGVIVYSMIVNAAPFLDEDEAIPIQQRIAQRQIDWGSLCEKNVSAEAFDFIQRLLEPDPIHRMSLTDALSHPWLSGGYLDEIPQEYSQRGGTASFANLSEDVAMKGASTNGSFAPPPPPPPPPATQSSRLVRRSQVIALTAALSQPGAVTGSPYDPDAMTTTGDKRMRVNGNGHDAGVMEVIDEVMEQEHTAPLAKRGRMNVDENDENDENHDAPGPSRPRRTTARINEARPAAVTRVTRAAAAAAASEEVRRSPRSTASRARR